MRASDFQARWDPEEKALELVFVRTPVVLTLASFGDVTYEKGQDTMVLRVVPTMTRYRFEEWEKSASSPTYRAIRAYIEDCEAARRPRR